MKWTLLNRSQDKRACNRVSATRPQDNVIVAHSGQCAFMFRGRPNEASVLRQRVDSSGLQVGETLTATAQVSAVNLPADSARLILRAKFTDNTTASVPIVIPAGSYDYTPVTLTASFDKPIRHLLLLVSFRGTSGRFYVDKVRVRDAD